MDAGRVYRVGRDPSNDIVIEHGSVSRNHCELRLLDDGAVLLVDLNSMNGTAVRQSGQWDHVEQATVERDERILLGEIVTTVAALLVRAPKTSDRRPAEPQPMARPMPAVRKIPKPTAPAEPDAPGLVNRLLHSDWARLHRRGGNWKTGRDEPSICLPAFISISEPDEPARLIRRPPTWHAGKPPRTHERDRPAPVLAAQHEPGASAPPGEEANAPVLNADGAPATPSPADAIIVTRREPSLLAGPVPAPADAAPGADFASPSSRMPQARRRRLPRWLPRPSSPEFAKWAVVGSALLLASGASVAAYIKYAPESAPETRVAAATTTDDASFRPDQARERERKADVPPGAVPPVKPSIDRKEAARPAKPAPPGRSRPWQHSIEGTPDSAVAAAAPARDGLCLAGTTTLTDGGHEAWVVRLDADGKLRWQRRPGGPKRDGALAVAAASDGGCVAAGFDSDETRLWIFKLDAKGVLVWSRVIPAGHTGRAVAIVPTRDGGYAVAAHAKASLGRPDRAFVLRLSASGEIKWSKYAGQGESVASDLRETQDGGFVVVGMGRERGNPRLALWAARLDRGGRTLWEEHYGGPGTPTGARIEVARAREFVIAASMTGPMPAAGDTPGTSLRLLRIADDGEVIWDRRHPGTARRVAGMVLVRGGILVAGDAGPDSAAPELWLAQFDAQGKHLRESRLPAAKGDRAAALAEMSDGRLVLVGTAEIEGAAQRGAGLIFVDRDRNLVAER